MDFDITDILLNTSSYDFEQILEAARQSGNAELMFRVAEHYKMTGNDRGYYFWLQKAAETGNTKASYDLGCSYLNGYSSSYSKYLAAPHRRDSYQKKGTELVKVAADKGLKDAFLILGIAYAENLKSDKSKEAVSYLEKYCNDDPKKIKAIANLFFTGEAEIGSWQLSAKENLDLAKLFFEKLPESDKDVTLNLANIYLQGKTQEDKETAVSYLKKYCGEDSKKLYSLSQAFYNGDNSFEKNDAVAMTLLKESAEKGCADAQLTLGNLYYEGKDVDKDYDLALSFIEKSCGDDAEKLFQAGEKYLGRAVSKETTEMAVKLLEKAVEKGSVEAKNSLANYYYYSYDGEKDYKKAFDLLIDAAFDGSEKARNQISSDYEFGRVFVKDAEKAKKWLELSPESSSKEDLKAEVYSDLEIFSMQKDIKDILENEQAYSLTQLLAAESSTHNSELQFFISERYKTNGEYKNSFLWAEKSAEQKNPDGQAELAWHYYVGHGHKTNKDTAVSICTEGAEKSALAKNLLGVIKCVEKKFDEAFELFSSAADMEEQKGCMFAQFNLGVMYCYGLGTELNFEKAYEMFKISASRECPQAISARAFLLSMGLGARANREQALFYWKNAAAQNDFTALSNLQILYKGGEDWVKRNNGLSESCAKKLKSLVDNEIHFSSYQIKFGDTDIKLNGLTCAMSAQKSYQNVPLERLVSLESRTHNCKIQFAISELYKAKQDYKNSFAWIQKAAAQNENFNDDILLSLAWHLKNGNGCEKDENKSLAICLPLVEKGNPDAVNLFIEISKIITKDGPEVKSAVKFLDKSLKKEENIQLEIAAGYFYKNVYRDKKALGYFEKAEELSNYENAEAELGIADTEHEINGDDEEAVRNWRLSSKHGSLEAVKKLGDAYKNGIGLEKNQKKAEALYKIASGEEPFNPDDFFDDEGGDYWYSRGIDEETVSEIEDVQNLF